MANPVSRAVNQQIDIVALHNAVTYIRLHHGGAVLIEGLESFDNGTIVLFGKNFATNDPIEITARSNGFLEENGLMVHREGEFDARNILFHAQNDNRTDGGA